MMDTDMGLDFRCDYANAVLDAIWDASMTLQKRNKNTTHIHVFLGVLERKALEVWLHQRGGYASMMNLPGMGPVGSKPTVFGFPIKFVKMDSHLRVRTWNEPN